MIWFQRLFPVFMLLNPLVFALCAKTKSTGEMRSKSLELMGQLWRATLVLLLVHIAVEALLETTRPANDPLRAVWPTLMAVGGSILLWLRWAGRAMAAKNPAYAPLAGNSPLAVSPQVQPVRTASLKPRHLDDPIGRPAWTLGWIVFLVCTGLTIWSITEGAPVVLLLSLGWWIGMSVFGARHCLQESEPRDRRDSPELETAYRSLRAFRSWSFFWMGLLATIAFTAVAVLVTIRPDLAGMTGGILGCSLGIGGALFGGLASLRRVKINELRLELERAAETAS